MPSRSAIPTFSAWRRPNWRRSDSRPACFTPSGCSRGSSPECATTATAWAFPPSTAPWPSIPAIWPIRLVFCGTVGVLPRGKSIKKVEPDDRIVAIGGRTGRDGIHGATFSSIELTAESETISGGAVQIGNAITEKMVLDVIVQARDHGLFRSITDCGAGGFSSAVGEMGAELGAEVELDQAPLKYEGLSYTEIWISEAQERMVLAVPPENGRRSRSSAEREDVEATDLGRFVDSGRLTLRYHGADRRRPVDALPPRRPADRCPRGDLDPARVTTARPPDRQRFHSRPARALATLGRLQQGMDRPPVRPRGAGADRRQAACGRAR